MSGKDKVIDVLNDDVLWRLKKMKAPVNIMIPMIPMISLPPGLPVPAILNVGLRCLNIGAKDLQLYRGGGPRLKLFGQRANEPKFFGTYESAKEYALVGKQASAQKQRQKKVANPFIAGKIIEYRFKNRTGNLMYMDRDNVRILVNQMIPAVINNARNETIIDSLFHLAGLVSFAYGYDMGFLMKSHQARRGNIYQELLDKKAYQSLLKHVDKSADDLGRLSYSEIDKEMMIALRDFFIQFYPHMNIRGTIYIKDKVCPIMALQAKDITVCLGSEIGLFNPKEILKKVGETFV